MSSDADLTVLALDKIRTDGGTQMRVELDQDHCNDLAEWLTDHPGQELDWVVVFYDGTHYWLADGFHRLRAYAECEPPRRHVEAQVIKGTQRDAILYAAGANTAHGLKRSSADKRKAVEALLRDKEWVLWSNKEVARRCGVSDMLVADVREAICKILADSRKATRGGTTYPMNTGGINANRHGEPDEDDGGDLDRDERWAREQGRPEPAETPDESGAGDGAPQVPAEPWGKGPLPPELDERDRLGSLCKLRRLLRKVYREQRRLRWETGEVCIAYRELVAEEAESRQRAG
jgi:hypothetical protein